MNSIVNSMKDYSVTDIDNEFTVLAESIVSEDKDDIQT